MTAARSAVPVLAARPTAAPPCLLCPALERDERALRADAELLQSILLGVEINGEDDRIGEFRVFFQRGDCRLLLGADRAPRRVDVDDDRLARLLCRGEGSGAPLNAIGCLRRAGKQA